MKLTCDHQQWEAYLAQCDYAIRRAMLEKKNNHKPPRGEGLEDIFPSMLASTKVCLFISAWVSQSFLGLVCNY